MAPMAPRPREAPTFKQTVVIARETLRQMPPSDSGEQLERIKRQLLALGFQYDPEQIRRALAALTDPARQWDQSRRRSARSTSLADRGPANHSGRGSPRSRARS
jgi:hypothetical protein